MQSILLLAQRHGIETGCVSNHTCLKQEDLTLQILSPSTERITGNANEDCIVMLLTFRDLRILFTGDLEKEGEAQFVKAFSKTGLFADDPMDSDPFMVLIAGHHGSQYATSEEFLDLVKPDLVLISCGRNNRYGHPSEKMLKRLRQEEIPYRRTDLEGAMQMIQ
jgi:competence protein ComEC